MFEILESLVCDLFTYLQYEYTTLCRKISKKMMLDWRHHQPVSFSKATWFWFYHYKNLFQSHKLHLTLAGLYDFVCLRISRVISYLIISFMSQMCLLISVNYGFLLFLGDAL